MTSYSKTATTIELYDVPRSIAEDPRIACLQSNLFWQVSCAKSKTKACTEISAWTIKFLLCQGLSESELYMYGYLVYELKGIVGSYNFSAQFIRIISHYDEIGYGINTLQQTAW